MSESHFLTLVLQVALIVAQSRDRQNRLSGIILTSLSLGLQRIAVAAKKMKGNRRISALVRSKSYLGMGLCEVGLPDGNSSNLSIPL